MGFRTGVGKAVCEVETRRVPSFSKPLKAGDGGNADGARHFDFDNSRLRKKPIELRFRFERRPSQPGREITMRDSRRTKER